MSDMKRDYTVEIKRIKTHVFDIDDVNSPEEAIEVAENMLEDGEEGVVIETDFYNADAYPVDSKEDD